MLTAYAMENAPAAAAWGAAWRSIKAVQGQCFGYAILRVFLFFFNDTATTEIYPLSLHDALPISQLPQGMSAMVTITTSTMQFVDGLTTLGFGSGDVAVRRLWVRSPTLAIANITVSPSALERSE